MKQLYPAYVRQTKADPEIGKALFLFDEARLELATIPDERDQEIAALEEQCRRGYMSEGEMRARIDDVKRAMVLRAETARKRFDETGERVAKIASGATLKVDNADRSRVRELLAAGTSADSILTRARERGELGMLAALAAEAAWHRIDGKFVEGMEEWEQQARRAYVELGGGEPLVALGLDIADAREQLKPIAEFTMKTVHDIGHRGENRIALGHALANDPHGCTFDPENKDPIGAAAGREGQPSA